MTYLTFDEDWLDSQIDYYFPASYKRYIGIFKDELEWAIKNYEITRYFPRYIDCTNKSGEFAVGVNLVSYKNAKFYFVDIDFLVIDGRFVTYIDY